MVNKGIFVTEEISVKDALKRLDKTAEKVLLVVDDKRKLLGAITDGDIRRYILKGRSLDNRIEEVYNKNPISIKKSKYSDEVAKSIFLESRIELLPIVDESEKVIDSIIWSKLFADGQAPNMLQGKIDVPIVIMAGGKGNRLYPYTMVLPKPLIPIGDKPVVEVIINEFRKQGANNYYLTLNYKAKMIEAYFSNVERDYELEFVQESEFSGTAGSLKMLEDKISDTFIVSNCDVIVRANFGEVVNFHKEQNADLTVLASIKHYKIPYGIIKFKEPGDVTSLDEKPEYTFTINSGVYVLDKKTLEFIPKEGSFDMTDLIKSLIKSNKKVIMYPVNENDYVDVGQWEEYKKATKKLKLFV